jgi:hypothetical protein
VQLASTALAIEGAHTQMVGIQADLAPALTDTDYPEADRLIWAEDDQEIYDKVRELAVGARLATQAAYDAADAALGRPWPDDAQRLLAETRLNSAETLEDGTPGAALIDLRNANFHLLLGQDVDATGSIVDFFDTLALLQNNIDYYYGFLDLIGVLPVNYADYQSLLVVDPPALLGEEVVWGTDSGVPDADRIIATLERVYLTVLCEAYDGNPPTGGEENPCTGFGGNDPTQPNSLDLALNVSDLLEVQRQFDLANVEYVASDHPSFTMALAASVIVGTGLVNSTGNICGGDAHPLIVQAQLQVDSLEALRAAMGDSSDATSDYRLTATDVYSRCLVMYVYNSAYIFDTAFPDRNYYHSGRDDFEDLEPLEVPGCGTIGEDADGNWLLDDPPTDPTLAMWYSWQDLVPIGAEDFDCACQDIDNNVLYCTEKYGP